KVQLRWVQRGILADPISGTAVLEYGPTEILPPVGAISKHPARLCRPGRQASRAHPRGKPGFSTFERGCGRETDCLLEGDGFEPSVPARETVNRGDVTAVSKTGADLLGNQRFESISLQRRVRLSLALSFVGRKPRPSARVCA